jgi:hypothetical protein
MKMARGREFGVWQPWNSESEDKKKRASMARVGTCDLLSTLAVPAALTKRRVPSPNRYMAFAKFCFCKNNKRTNQPRQA